MITRGRSKKFDPSADLLRVNGVLRPISRFSPTVRSIVLSVSAWRSIDALGFTVVSFALEVSVSGLVKVSTGFVWEVSVNTLVSIGLGSTSLDGNVFVFDSASTSSLPFAPTTSGLKSSGLSLGIITFLLEPRLGVTKALRNLVPSIDLDRNRGALFFFSGLCEAVASFVGAASFSGRSGLASADVSVPLTSPAVVPSAFPGHDVESPSTFSWEGHGGGGGAKHTRNSSTDLLRRGVFRRDDPPALVFVFDSFCTRLSFALPRLRLDATFVVLSGIIAGFCELRAEYYAGMLNI